MNDNYQIMEFYQDYSSDSKCIKLFSLISRYVLIIIANMMEKQKRPEIIILLISNRDYRPKIR